jgi:hypothetical protein
MQHLHASQLIVAPGPAAIAALQAAGGQAGAAWRRRRQQPPTCITDQHGALDPAAQQQHPHKGTVGALLGGNQPEGCG